MTTFYIGAISREIMACSINLLEAAFGRRACPERAAQQRRGVAAGKLLAFGVLGAPVAAPLCCSLRFLFCHLKTPFLAFCRRGWLHCSDNYVNHIVNSDSAP
jgi:hypothetical protein